jgi:ABC-type transport system involved in cytochrome c biogenesis permease subunit
MSRKSSKAGRWAAAVLVVIAFAAVFFNLVRDNMPKGEVRQIEGYTPWEKATLEVAETLPVQNGGRIKPLSTYAGFTMLGLHGARSMEIEGEASKLSGFSKLIRSLRGKNERTVNIKPTAWMLDTLFRPQLAIQLPTFRIDNSSVLEAIGVKSRGKRDRYSYNDIEPGRQKLIELAQSYEKITKTDRDPVQAQTIDLAYNLREYESLLGYFGFARFGVELRGTGKDGAPDQRADISAVMQTAPQIRQQIQLSQSQGQDMDSHLKDLLQQVFDAANFAKFGLFILPPADPKDETWKTAGNAIAEALGDTAGDTTQRVADVKALENTARALGENEAAFRKQLIALRADLVKRAETRSEYAHIVLEAGYYRADWFLNAIVFFIFGTLCALVMWTAGQSKTGRVFSWLTFGFSFAGLALCIIAIVQRCIIMQRPPVGNLYDTIIFIATTGGILALIVELITRRRFALGIAPVLALAFIILARRFELGDPKDNMDPLVAVLDSNYWLTTHVITITLGYAAGLLSALLSVFYLLIRGLGLVDDDRDVRRFFTRTVYGTICLTLFLALVGTVLGGIWANDSWGRFWGWDPKENGALLIVLWTLAILHARLGGYIREWGLHFAAVFTGAVVAFSWWHVNFLGVGLHNYGFTAGKNSIYIFYGIILLILGFGIIAKILDDSRKSARKSADDASGKALGTA